MHEIIIKILEKEPEDHKEISACIQKALTHHKFELKSAFKRGTEGQPEDYSNEIWQIGKKEVDPDTWKIKIEEE